jgi:hypothetical protein
MEKKTRFTSKIKTEAVFSLLRGESIEAVARKYGVTIADLNFWRDQRLCLPRPLVREGARNNRTIFAVHPEPGKAPDRPCIALLYGNFIFPIVICTGHRTNNETR